MSDIDAASHPLAEVNPRNPVTANGAGRTALLLGAVLAGIVTVAYSLLVRGPFQWHVAQPAYWQGAIEVALLWMLVWGVLSSRVPLAWRTVLLWLPVALYLRRHHVDGPLLVAWAWMEGLFALGAVLLGRARGAWLREFFAGVALCGALLWVTQWLGYGAPRTQRLIAIALLLPPLLWQWRRWQVLGLLRAAFALEGAAARLAAAAVIALICAMFARSNAVADFDSVWYGLRPERVLVGERSVFEALGLASPVYYFPKFWEVLTLPLAAAREYSLIQGAAILCGGLLARVVFDWLRALGHGSLPALAGALLAWSIPAFLNVTLGAKPDMFAALCTVALAWFAWRRGVLGEGSALPWGLAAAGLAMSSKLAVMPYVALAGLGLIAATRVTALAPTDAREGTRGWLVVGLCTLIGGLVCLRTWTLTGLPTIGPEQLVALWNALGLRMRLPAGTLEWVQPQVWSHLPDIALGWLVDPSRLSHILASWPGHCWLVLALGALLFRSPSSAREGGVERDSAVSRGWRAYEGNRRDMARWTLWLLPACGLTLLVFIGFTNIGGDGNYFLAPVVMATIASFDLLLRRAPRRAALWAAAMYAVFHFLVSFASAGWATGTRGFDLDFARAVRDSEASDAAELQAHGLQYVAAALQERGGRLRVWGLKADATGYRLPARYENVHDVVSAHWPLRDSLPALENLMACAGVQAWLLPVEPGPLGTHALDALAQRLRMRDARFILHRDESWLLMSTQGLLGPCVP